MSRRDLRDKNNKLLGTITTLSSGKLELRSANSRLLGTYDPKRDETRDAQSRLVGKGNLLTTLLERD